jgi:hypothetical protein
LAIKSNIFFNFGPQFLIMKISVLILALGFSVTGLSQNGKLSLQKGQKFEVVTETKKEASMPMASTVNATVTEVYDVQDAGSNGFVLEHKVKHVLIDANAMGQSQKFDSEKEEDLNGELGKMLGKSIKNKYTVTLDATGNVTAVKLDDDNPNDNDEVASLVSAQLGLNLTPPKTGSKTSLTILPQHELKQGETWTDSVSADGETRKTKYSVSNISGDDIMIDFTEESNVEASKEVMGQKADFKIKSTNTGKITVDKKTGFLKSKTTTGDAEGTIQANGQSIPAKEKSTITITVK